MIGILIYDPITQRYDIHFGLDEYYGGLHCGQCFDVLINGLWESTRIEYSWNNEKWYLVGFNNVSLNGLKVKI